MALLMCTVTGCTAGEEVQTVTCLAENPETKETTVYEQAVTAAETESDTVYVSEVTADTGVEETTLGDPDGTETEASTEKTSDTSAEMAYGAEKTMGYFSENFLKEAFKDGENFIISPLSAKLALNMAAAGAEEGSATEKELLDLFGYESASEMKKQSKAVIGALSRGKGVIEVNNLAWVSDKLDGLKDGYSGDLDKYFGAESFTENLSGNEFVDKLNGWVNENTKGLIPQLLSEPLSDDARLALVNTLYFKNKWVAQFDSYSTYDADFFGTEKTAAVPTMHNEFHMDYCEGERLKSVILPYVDGSEMRIFLPADDTENISDVIAEMSAEELSAELNGSYENKNVRISMPKFECDYSGSLTEMLQRLGAKAAFDPSSASFGNMADTGDERLYISDVFQAAKIICDEEGTEAAAATAVTMAMCAAVMLEETIEFTVDRPFVYEILSPDGETLFMGYMGNL